MAEIAVTVAIFLVDKVILYISEDGKNSPSDDFQNITDLLSALQAYINAHRGRGSQNAIQANKEAQTRDMVYQIEDALDEYMFNTSRKSHKNNLFQFIQGRGASSSLRQLSAQISEISKRFKQLQDLSDYSYHPDPIPDTLPNHHTGWGVDSFLHSPEEDEIVGFEYQTFTLLDQLLREEQNRHMQISVVGPGGFGKSTLVRIAYLDKQVKEHFDCSAWVTLSERFHTTTMLVESMASQFGDEIKESQMRSYLQQKRYLVVLDGVYNKKDLQLIENLLPKNCGSRIIVTTHKHDLAVCDDESPHRVHDLSSGLSEDAAWSLFSRRAFHGSGKRCPLELESIAKSISSMCGGSPSAIVSVSRKLARKAQLPAEWQVFYNTMGCEIGTDPDCKLTKTLIRSYNDLSCCEKSCYLYLSLFPRDYHINRGRLIRLWLAEGFLESKRKDSERVADEYLDQLISWNLIDVAERDFSGRAVVFEVKNLMHEFLINKSNEEKFVTTLSDKDAETSYGRQLRRTSIPLDAVDLSILLTPDKLRKVRTCFIFSEKDASQTIGIGSVIGGFHLLKVLDLQGSRLENFPEEICNLTLLSYLSLRGTNIKSIPGSIENLVFMETLDLKQTQVRTLPKEILRLSNLMYLLVYLYDVESYVKFNSVEGVELCPEVSSLSKLRKLTLIKAKDSKFIEELGLLKKLTKLGLVHLKTQDGRKLCAAIQKMTQLSTLDVSSVSESSFLDLHDMTNPPLNLQRLYLKGRLTKIPNWISSLQSLVRIGLLWSKLAESPIPALQVLPNLIDLQLVDAYIGPELVFETGYLGKLRILNIDECSSLTRIIIQENAIPKLGKLILCNCKSLLLPPHGIDNLAQLQEFHAVDMNDEFTTALGPSSNNNWMVARIPAVRSFHLGGNGEWIPSELF